MPNPSTRDDSSLIQFRVKVPADVRQKAKGRLIFVPLPAIGGDEAVTVTARIGEHVKLSLRTRDPYVAKARHGAALAHVNQVFAGMRSGPRTLSLREIVALSGDCYRLFLDECGDEPGPVENWTAIKGFNRAVREGRITVPPTLRPDPRRSNEIALAREVFGIDLSQGIDDRPAGTPQVSALEARFGLLASWTLMRQGVEVGPDDRVRLLKAIERAVTDAAVVLKRHARLDFTPAPEVEARFPAFELPKPPLPPLTMTVLLERWRVEAKPALSTARNWTQVKDAFAAFLGHDDATRVTAHDVVAFKDHLVDRGTVAPRTINSIHLSALKRLFAFAVDNRMMRENPALNVKVVDKARAGQGRLPYTDDEIARLLALAAQQIDHSVRRWVPLVTALTGARVGEVMQAWGNQITVRDGIPVFEIRPAPDGGTLKNAVSERSVPLHPAIVASGFVEWAAAKGDGPLFYRKGSGNPTRAHPSLAHVIRLAEWIRANGFTDPRKSPSHATRHWFKTTLHRIGVLESTVDALQGHAGKGEAANYRHFALSTLAEAIERLPVPFVPG